MKPRERKPHWLGRTDGGEMPPELFFAGISSELSPVPDVHGLHVEFGRKAHLLGVSYANGQPHVFDEFSCGATSDFWQFCAKGLRRRVVNWLYIRGLDRAMSLLRGWELAEAAGMKILAACLTDPPCFVRCSIAGRTLLIVDSRNYGDEFKNAIATEQQANAYIDGSARSLAIFHEVAAQQEAYSIQETIQPIYLGIMSLGGCGWKPTISGLAWSLYRRHFIPEVNDAWAEENNV